MKPLLCLFAFFALLTSLPAQKWDTLSPIPAQLTFPVTAVVDGHIHIMGGGGVGGATNAHYAYDPDTDMWESKAPVPYLAQQPAGTGVNGNIHYFGGGYPNTGTPLKNHYIYDPATDSWSQAADLTVARAIHYAVNLDETLYSLAGQGVANLCQTYDAVNNSWITKNNLPDNSFWYGAHVATGGHIYRFGGGGYTAPVNKAHRYDPATDSWAALPNLPNAIHALRGAAIGDKIFLAGGYFDFQERDEVWIFDTDTETYTAGIPLPLGRNYHNMVMVDSCIYVLGGNHAIDLTVRTQLIRLCPFDVPSAVVETLPPAPLWTSWFDGVLKIKVPDPEDSVCQLAIYDLTGSQVWFGSYPLGKEGDVATMMAGLTPGMYFIKVNVGKKLFTGKFLVP